MKHSPPTRKLREHPDLDQLKRQAKELLAAFRAGDPSASDEVNAHYHGANPESFALHGAQLVLARSYGFDSWPKLKAYVDGVTVARLAEAVRASDIKSARKMLKTRPELADMDISENNEHRALHYAVFGRSPEMVRLLMDHGADARKGIYPHRDATRALTIATERGYGEIVAIIHEAEQRRRAAHGNTGAPAPSGLPQELSDAIRNGDEPKAIALLEADPSLIHASQPDGVTPLHLASARLMPQLAEWLLDRGAGPNRRSDRGLTPLDVLGLWTTEAAGSIASLSDLLLRHGAERTPRWAVAMGEADWLRARHAEGKLVNPPDGDGLLTIAVRHGRPEILKLLLDLGFDPDERIRVGGLEEVVYSWGRPLQLCAAANQLAMARMLLERGADPNGEIYAAGTPVSTAYRARGETMLKLLLDRGGILQAATAGYHRDSDLARRMLADEAAGRLPPGTVPAGSTVALQLIDGDCGDPEIVRMALGSIDWPRDDPRWYGVLRGPLAFWNHIPWIESEKWPFDRATYLACFRLILARCHANVGGSYGRTILHDVVAMGRREGVRDWITEDEVLAFATVLLDAGARLEVRDDLLKSTPLGWACRWGRAKLVKLMLERGADPIEADAEPWARPRAWAEKLGHRAVLQFLDEKSP